MRINLSHFEETQNTRRELHQRLKLGPQIRLDLAFDGVHGINELTRSLADLYPHKRAIAVLGPQPTPVVEIVVQFVAQGFSAQTLDLNNLSESWEKLKKDTLFVLTVATEPFSGFSYPLTWLREEAAKKNIFTLIYQGPDSLSKGVILPKNGFEGVCADPLWGQKNGLSLILKGERCQGDKLLWGEARYEEENVRELEAALANHSGSVENKNAVLDFEDKIKGALAKGITTLNPKFERLYDRAVLFIEGVEGDSLVHALKEQNIDTSTAAACFWNSPHTNTWLPPLLGIESRLVQSSVIIPLSELSKANAQKALIESATQLRKMSNFN